MDEVIVKGMPDSLRHYIVEICEIPVSAFFILPGAHLPEPARKLLFHLEDMTSTLAGYYGSKLHVECIQKMEKDDVYMREVFLRTLDTDTIVEYGVIAIVLNNFTAEQREEIESDTKPLGGLLHTFKIPFKSSPVCFFSISAEYLSHTPLKNFNGTLFYGRFNQLSKASGQPLAWIMEILPGGFDRPAAV